MAGPTDRSGRGPQIRVGRRLPSNPDGVVQLLSPDHAAHEGKTSGPPNCRGHLGLSGVLPSNAGPGCGSCSFCPYRLQVCLCLGGGS